MKIVAFNNPYHVPKETYLLLNEIEALIKTLHLNNLGSVKNNILSKLNQIFTSFKSIERDLERFELCSNSEIARFQVLIGEVSAFRAMVEMLFSNQEFKTETQLEKLQKELERRFKIIIQIITRKMSQLEPVIRKQQERRLTYH